MIIACNNEWSWVEKGSIVLEKDLFEYPFYDETKKSGEARKRKERKGRKKTWLLNVAKGVYFWTA